MVTTSCSLLHTPLDLDAEPPSDVLDDELRSWMAFAKQKVGEVVTLARGLGEGREAIAAELDANDRALEDRRISERTRNPAVRERVAALTDEDARRQSPFEVRREAQRDRLAPAALPHHDDRLLPPDRGDPPARAIASPGRDRRGRRTSAGCARRSSA